MNFFIIEYGSNRFVVYKFCCCLNNLVFVVFNNLVVVVDENLLGVYKQPKKFTYVIHFNFTTQSFHYA